MHIRFNNLIITNVLCSFLIHVKYEKRKWQYLTKENVSSKYRVEPESKKINVDDVLD